MYISVDPYQRPYTARMTPPLTMIGSSVATIEESKHPGYPEGSDIIIYDGWVERDVANPEVHGALGPPQIVPKLGNISKTHLLGLLEIFQPKA